MINILKGYASAYIAYLIAKIFEKRNITSTISQFEKYYKITFEQRKIYCRDKLIETLHFAASFANPSPSKFITKDDCKNFVLNRGNIFFDKLDSEGLDAIWETLLKEKPFLVHGHPSTLYVLVCHLENRNIPKKIFEIFESSGELLQTYMKDKIHQIFGCKIINRYGLVEFGGIAYELNGMNSGLKILDSEGWAESRETKEGYELIFTGFHNRLMPLIRYTTGDMAKIEERSDGWYMVEVVGRIHDMVTIDDINYPTHSIMDVLDHQLGGIKEFQIDIREEKSILRVAIDDNETPENILLKIKNTRLSKLDVEFVDIGDFIRVEIEQNLDM